MAKSEHEHVPSPDTPTGDPSLFDEGLFPVRYPRLQAGYDNDVTNGYVKMANSKVIILGLARDIAHMLPWTIPRIEKTGELFADYRVCVYENDSSDITSLALRGWEASNKKVWVESEEVGDPINPPTRCLNRMERMAKYRNRLRRCVRTINRQDPSFDHVIIVDMDLPGGWSYDGLANTFGKTGWDAVASNGMLLKHDHILQYDAWAFRRHGSDEPLDCRTVNIMYWHRGDPLEQVYSAFGGMAVYKSQALVNFAYGGDDCEHARLYRSMRHNGMARIYLNPSQVVLYTHQHRIKTWQWSRQQSESR
jgi:hypothetical protein